MGNIFYQDSLNLHKRNETMDSIKSIANFTPNFKTASFNKNYSANSLKLLTKDTISFGARIPEKEEAVNTDWIDDKNIKKIITRIFSDGHARLTRKEILDLLRYFNYELKRNTGDEYYKHKYLDTNGEIENGTKYSPVAIIGGRSCKYNCTFCFHRNKLRIGHISSRSSFHPLHRKILILDFRLVEPRQLLHNLPHKAFNA